jgi:hypothetical protein
VTIVAAIVAPELQLDGTLLKYPRWPQAAAPIISQTKKISVFLDTVASASCREPPQRT